MGRSKKSILRYLLPGLAIAALVWLSFASFGGRSRPVASDPGPSGEWLSRAELEIRQAEYEISWQSTTQLSDLDASWHAPNRAHNLRTYFTGRGIRVIPRRGTADDWELDLSLIGYGRAGDIRLAESVEPSPYDNRVDYVRTGITEWYLNDPRGLEQGFTLDAPPWETGRTNRANAGPVHIELALGGGLSPKISSKGQAIDFLAPGGVPVLRYAKLFVYDATEAKLPARMEGFNRSGTRGIRIVVDDRDALYPVTVDPLLTNPSWTAEGEHSGSDFGFSVSTAGDINGDGYSDVIVGSPLYDNGFTDEGKAYVYLGSASGLTATPDWSVEGEQLEAQMGFSVSTAGDVNGDDYSDVIVGALAYRNVEFDEGGAFVYHGSASGLSATADWVAEGGQNNAFFGSSVSTAGDVNLDGYSDVIVGARGWDNGENGEGRVDVYHGSSSGLSATAAWTYESDQANAGLGRSVSTAGDVNCDGYSDVILGASGWGNGESNEGRVWVFRGGATGLSDTANWSKEGNQSGALYGSTVATAGDVTGSGCSSVIIGAEGWSNGESGEGAAFVYYGKLAGLSQTPDWMIEGGQENSKLGRVAAAGDVNGDDYADVLVGVRDYDNGETNEGRALVYYGSHAGPSSTPDWVFESDQAGAKLGRSAGTAGDVNGDGYADLIVGASKYSGTLANQGRALVFFGAAGGPGVFTSYLFHPGQMDSSFGFSLASGDLNGDGFSDAIVGAPGYDRGEIDEGRVFMYDGPVLSFWTSREGNRSGARFGSSVATGDVNGDGLEDLIVGAPLYDNGETEEGAAFAYHSPVDTVSETPSWLVEADQAGALFGSAVAAAGDLDGDGFADVIVGAPGYATDGQAFVYHGSSAGLSAAADWTATSGLSGPDHAFGSSVAAAGDVNRDGYSDVIVGDSGYNGTGAAFVYHGSTGGLPPAPDWTEEGTQNGSIFGFSVSTAGDVNGDGYADVVIGSEKFTNGETEEGAAFVYHGSGSGLPATPNWTVEADQANAAFGRSRTAGDVNGDGYADLIVGARLFDNGETDEGAAFVYFGSSAGLSTAADWMAEGNQAGAEFGRGVAAGDTNGDGYSEPLVGAPGFDSGGTDAGRVYLLGPFPYSLAESPNPRQRNVGGPTLISNLLVSDSGDGFGLAVRGRTPLGVGRVKLEWEVKPLGVFFDGSGTDVSDFWRQSGSEFNELVSGLLQSEVYHWRLRLLYDPVQMPYQPAGRWMTNPANGNHEADLRTGVGAPNFAGRVPDGGDVPGDPLKLGREANGDLTLVWGDSCTLTDDDYAVYEGFMTNFTHHFTATCSTGGMSGTTITPRLGNTYYLVVPQSNGNLEGSYGRDSDGLERAVGVSACLPQAVGSCQ